MTITDNDQKYQEKKMSLVFKSRSQPKNNHQKKIDKIIIHQTAIEYRKK